MITLVVHPRPVHMNVHESCCFAPLRAALGALERGPREAQGGLDSGLEPLLFGSWHRRKPQGWLKTPPHPTPPNIKEIVPYANWGVLLCPKGAETPYATFWTPRSPNLVTGNCHIFMLYDSLHFWKVTSSPNGPRISKLVLGFFLKARGFRSGGLRRKYILKK